MRRQGFTLVETLVVLAIVGILLALLLPAVQFARETARRAQCASNLRQLLIGVHLYEGAYGVLPPGNMNGFSLHASVLPYVEQEALAKTLVQMHQQSPGGAQFFLSSPVLAHDVPVYRCPSDDASRRTLLDRAATNYAGCLGIGVLARGFDGAFPLESSPDANYTGGCIGFGQVTDGASNTAAVSEVLAADGSDHVGRAIFATASLHQNPQDFEALCDECLSHVYLMIPGPSGSPVPAIDPYERGRPWAYGSWGTLYTHSLAPFSPSCYNQSQTTTGVYSAYSRHPGGVHVGYVDAHIKFMDKSINLAVWRSLGSRNGAEANGVP